MSNHVSHPSPGDINIGRTSQNISTTEGSAAAMRISIIKRSDYGVNKGLATSTSSSWLLGLWIRKVKASSHTGSLVLYLVWGGKKGHNQRTFRCLFSFTFYSRQKMLEGDGAQPRTGSTLADIFMNERLDDEKMNRWVEG